MGSLLFDRLFGESKNMTVVLFLKSFDGQGDWFSFAYFVKLFVGDFELVFLVCIFGSFGLGPAIADQGAGKFVICDVEHVVLSGC